MLFGKKTKLKIPLEDIISVKKTKSILIFDSAIQLTLKDDLELTLQSFLSRDNCFDIIQSVLRKH